MIMASNSIPNWVDKAGSVSRRLLPFPFEKVVTNKNMNLGELLKNELPFIALRCIFKYRQCIEKNPGEDFWVLVPEELKESREECKVLTNPLYDFIQNGDNYYSIVFNEKAEPLLLSTFQAAYTNHLKFHPDLVGTKHKSKIDNFSAFKEKKYEIIEKYMCTVCKKESSVEMCGNHYDPKHRSRRKWIKNMVLEKKQQTVDLFSY